MKNTDIPAAVHPQWEIVHCKDSAISVSADRALRRLLSTSFPFNPVFLWRRHLRERPGHRWLIMDLDGEIIAHAALHEKTISINGQDVRIGGVAEVCVAARHRGRGLSKALLSTVHEWLHLRQIPFAMLFGKPKLYVSSGYAMISNALLTTNSFLRGGNPFRGKPMIKSISGERWKTGCVDLRGPTF